MRGRDRVNGLLERYGRRTGIERPRDVVLAYHSVTDNGPCPDATPALFRAQLAALQERAEIVAVTALLDQERTKHRSRVSVTFDDGYRDNALEVREILKEFDVRASFFVTTGLIERDTEVIARFGATTGQPGVADELMKWDDLEKLLADGHEVGCHTYGHQNMALMARSEQEEDLERSLTCFEQRLGWRPTLFAYPYGKPKIHFTDTSEDVVRDCGYGAALAIRSSPVTPRSGRYRVPRFAIRWDNPGAVVAKVEGAYDLVGRYEAFAPDWLRKRLSPQDYLRE